MNFDTIKSKQAGKAYALPLITILFAFTISLAKGGYEGMAHGQLAFVSNPINLVILGTAYLISVVIFFLNFKVLVSILWGNRIYLFGLLYALSTVLISSFPIRVIINFFHYLGMTLTIILFIYYVNTDTKKLFQIFSVYAFIEVTLNIFSVLLFPSIGIHPKFLVWRGLTANPNNLGYVAYMSIWMALFSFYFPCGKIIKTMSLLTIFGACLCLFKSNSLTSMICAAFVLSAGPVLVSIEHNKLGTAILKIFFLGISFLLLLSVIYAFYPEWLGLNQIFGLVGRDSGLSGRTTLWEIGLQAFLKKPFWGWSYDTSNSVLVHSFKSFGQFHNGYLNNALAGGCIGTIILLLLIGKQLLLCIKLRKKNFRMAMGFLVLVLSIMIHNIAEASFFNTTNVLWLMFVFSLYYLTYQLKSPQ
jgi:O-antigen ligase